MATSRWRCGSPCRTNPDDPATEIGRTDLMEHKALTGGTFGPGTAGKTLQKAVFDGRSTRATW